MNSLQIVNLVYCMSKYLVKQFIDIPYTGFILTKIFMLTDEN